MHKGAVMIYMLFAEEGKVHLVFQTKRWLNSIVPEATLEQRF